MLPQNVDTEICSGWSGGAPHSGGHKPQHHGHSHQDADFRAGGREDVHSSGQQVTLTWWNIVSVWGLCMYTLSRDILVTLRGNVILRLNKDLETATLASFTQCAVVLLWKRMILFLIVVNLCNEWRIIVQFIWQVARTSHAVTCFATETQKNALKPQGHCYNKQTGHNPHVKV